MTKQEFCTREPEHPLSTERIMLVDDRGNTTYIVDPQPVEDEREGAIRTYMELDLQELREVLPKTPASETREAIREAIRRKEGRAL